MDRTSLIHKIKGAATGKIGMAAGVVGVGVIALAVGMHVGKRGDTHGEVAAHPEHAAQAEVGEGHAGSKENKGKHEGEKHELAQHETHDSREGHEAAQEAHAEHVAMNGEAQAAHEGGGAASEESHAAQTESAFQKIFGTYSRAWGTLQEKVEDVRTAQVENERLRLENNHLRLQLEGLQFNCSAKEASSKTHSIEYKLDKETGSQVGRDLASIAYRVPTNLVPGQLYTLGISYFKAREDEKAAVIFTFLTGMDDNEVFRTPKNFLLTGIAWYRLDNFATAERYFDRALKAQEKPENLQTLAHARMWKALVASRTGKHTQSQFWLTELIDHHPLSVEASWINSKGPRPKPPEAQRGTASEE